jgi:hypothetical protein
MITFDMVENWILQVFLRPFFAGLLERSAFSFPMLHGVRPEIGKLGISEWELIITGAPVTFARQAYPESCLPYRLPFPETACMER